MFFYNEFDDIMSTKYRYNKKYIIFTKYNKKE